MIKNHFRIVLRRLRKNLISSGINISGLTWDFGAHNLA
jgi:hypothetical protein